MGQRGRIIALEVTLYSPKGTAEPHILIVVKSTRFDDGHLIGWHLENDGGHATWPAMIRLDPSMVSSSQGMNKNANLGVRFTHSLRLGHAHMCLDDLEKICLRAPLPDFDLGEDQSSWCLDILYKMEQQDVVEKGQTLLLEAQLSKFRYESQSNEADVLKADTQNPKNTTNNTASTSPLYVC